LCDFGKQTLSGLNLWNRNTEQVADTLSRDKLWQNIKCKNLQLY